MRLDGGVTNYYRQLGFDAIPGVEYFSVNSASADSVPAKLLFFLGNSLRYLRRLASMDAVHVNPSLNPGSFYRDALLILLARLAGKTILVTMHGWSYEFEQRLRGSIFSAWLFRRSYARVDAYIVLGEVFKQRLQQLGLPAGTPVFVDTTIADDAGFEPERVRPAKADRRVVNFLFLARIVKEKGLEIALDAFDLCRRRLPEQKMHFYIAGDGPALEEIRALHATDPDISFLGHVDEEARQALLEKSHFLIFPTSHGEGLPCTILECMLYGMPVLTRPEGAIGEIIVNGTHGLLTGSRDPEPYAAYASELLNDPAAYERVSGNNMQEAMEKYRASAVQARVLSIYRELFPGFSAISVPPASAD
jgi:glycosyltransferase involved in cell wall biosynthesis